MKQKTERQLALEILIAIFRDSSYSNLELGKRLPKGNQEEQKKQLVTALVYGVVERSLTLDYLISQYSKKPLKRLDLEIVLILKMGFYQLLYLDRIPENAAVNETVKLCDIVRKSSAKGFVNGILRSFLRDGKKLFIGEKDDCKALSIAYSCPEWLIRQWSEEYSYEEAKELAKASIGRPPLMIRVNTLKTDDISLSHQLKEEGMEVIPNNYLDHCLQVSNTKNLEQSRSFQRGDFYVQDLASQYCAKLAGVKPGDHVFDLCAAPGGKSFTMAQYMENRGELRSFDLYAHKLELIEKTAQKLGITCLTTQISDASQFRDDLGQADVVLCDVPCAGLGIIRRKPEIKYKDPEQLKQLPQLQYSILKNACRYVKPGGRLVYSTCSLSMAENQNNAKRFLQDFGNEFVPVPMPEELKGKAWVEGNMATFFPRYMNSDGFFVALFQRRNSNTVEI